MASDPPPLPVSSVLLASSLSGLASRLLCHPLDTIKSRMQSPFMPRPSAVPSTLAKLYLGLPATIVGGVPGTVIYLTSYDYLKSIYPSKDGGGGSNFVRDFGAGIGAETLACIVYVPVDVVKERMQIQSRSVPSALRYRNSYHALVSITRREGLLGIYKGYSATLLSFGPFSAFYFMFYEQLKHRCLKNNEQKQLSFPVTVSISAAAGAAASFITSPLDLAKLRMQVSRGTNSSGVEYNSFWRSLGSIYRREGVQGLFRGSFMRVLFFCPATAVTMGCYEYLKSSLGDVSA